MASMLTTTPALLLILCASVYRLGCCGPSSEEFSILEHEPVRTAATAAELFEQWMEKHGKIYSHSQEKVRRFENFRKNLAFVNQRNARRTGGGTSPLSSSYSGHAVGLNAFADLSNEEFKEIYLPNMSKAVKRKVKRKNLAAVMKESPVKTCDAPSSMDWRKKGVVTAVKDQGECGSCWAFSSTGAIEGINAITTGDLISLSEQELVDCDSTNEGCEGGYMDYAFEWVVDNGGIDTEADYPYTGQNGTCSTAKEERKVVTLDGYEDVTPEDTALLCAVVEQPVSVGIDGSSLDFQLYIGGIYDGDCSGNPDDIDHAVLIVGYGTKGSTDYWIVKNSWGTSWGIQGYIYIKRNTALHYGVCAINAMASYPTKQSSSPSPYPSPAVPPFLPPPPPPPPPSPLPSQCGDLSYCPSGETCCCLFEFGDLCLVYGCCAYENAVCCTGTVYCCPQDYPICDVPDGLCLQNTGDLLGVAARKRKIAKHKLPWSKSRGASEQYQTLMWKRDGAAAMR